MNAKTYGGNTIEQCKLMLAYAIRDGNVTENIPVDEYRDLIQAAEQNQELREALRGLLELETRYTNCGLKEFDRARRALHQS